MKRIVLDGLWEAEAERLENNSAINQGDKLSVSIPGDIRKALVKAGVIPDPVIGLNGRASGWVGTASWRISRSFTLGGEKAVYYKGPAAEINGIPIPGGCLISQAVHSGENEIAIRVGADLPSGLEIIATDSHAMIDAEAAARHTEGDAWTVDVFLSILSVSDGEITVSTELHGKKESRQIAVREGIGTYSFSIPVEKPELWYPNGYGYPHLYPFSVSIGEWRKDSFIAFRADTRIFVKGAIWSGLDGDADSHDFEHLVKSAAEANINTLFTNKDDCRLKDAADRYGIIVRKCPPDMMTGRIDLMPSPPSMSTVMSFTTGRADFSMASPVMEAHEDEPGLCRETERLTTENFLLPSTFEKGIYLSQLYAALDAADKTARMRAGQEVTGILFGKLNDTWPSIGRSAVEYGGKWKIPMYAARLFYSPVCPLMFIENDILRIFVVNDSAAPVKAELSVKFRSFDGKKRDSREYPVELPPSGIREIDSFRLGRLQQKDLFCYAKLSTKNMLRERNLLLSDFRSANLEDPGIRWECRKTGPRSASIRVQVEKPAFYVTLDAGTIQGTFSDNMISVRPSAEKSVTFRADEDIDLEAFQENLRIYDLFNAMH